MGGVAPRLAPPAGQTIPASTVQSSVLRIGSVAFAEDEHPAEITFGGSQLVAVHNLIGGGRVVHSLGPQPQPVEWTGYLWEDRLANRVSVLYGYLKDGGEQLIQYLSEVYYGIVKEFLPTYYGPYFAKYKIAVEITRDANGQYTQASQISIDRQANDLLTIAGQSSSAAVTLDTNASATQTAVQTIGATLAATGPISQAAGNLGGLQTSIANAIATATTYMNTLSSSNLAQQNNIQSVLTALNLLAANVAAGQSVVTIQVDGGIRLDQIAAKYYGDPTLAGAIAAANNLPSMRLPCGQSFTLALPPLVSTNPLLKAS